MKSIFCHKAKAVPPAVNTLRFEFGNHSYNPVTAGVGSSGTWKRCEFMPGNVWDWTNTNTSWATAFGGGGTGIPGAFVDYENNPVKVIAAGDTSTVTNFSRFFQNCYAITEVCPIDTSNATTVQLMFSHLHNCEKFPDMDFSNAVDNNGTAAVYQSCYKMKVGPNIVFPTNHTFSLQDFFMGSCNLETVPLYNTEQCINMSSMFSQYMIDSSTAGNVMKLKSVPKFNTSKVTNMKQMFCGCVELETIPEFDTSNVTKMPYFLSGEGAAQLGYEMSIKAVPNLNYSKCTDFDAFMRDTSKLELIPEMNIEANVTRCDYMFKNCHNVKSGQKALYDKLSAIATITNYTDCFKDCGSDTTTGAAELAQIPTSWGGTKEAV